MNFSISALEKLRSVADYQFGKGIGRKLFPENVEIKISKKTGKIRYVYLKGKLLATVRAKDHMIALTINGAKNLSKLIGNRLKVVVSEEVEDVISKGHDVFAKHVIYADPEIRPREEVIVTNKRGQVIAVGSSLLTGKEMMEFKIGKAVKVRMGRSRG